MDNKTEKPNPILAKFMSMIGTKDNDKSIREAIENRWKEMSANDKQKSEDLNIFERLQRVWGDRALDMMERSRARTLQAQLREQKRWQNVGYLTKQELQKDGTVKTVEVKTKEGARIPIRRPTVYTRRNKYDVKAIRRMDTLKAVAGVTHFNDGTPIVQERLVDLW